MPDSSGASVHLDAADARTVHGTLPIQRRDVEFRTGIQQAIDRLSVFRLLEAGPERARLVSRGGTALNRMSAEVQLDESVLRVVVTPTVRFTLGPSTERLRRAAQELVDALDAVFG
jgi:hypothetical protein